VRARMPRGVRPRTEPSAIKKVPFCSPKNCLLLNEFYVRKKGSGRDKNVKFLSGRNYKFYFLGME